MVFHPLCDADGQRLNPDATDDLSYFDEATKQRFYPHVIEPAAGVNRTVLAVLMDAYSEKTNDKAARNPLEVVSVDVPGCPTVIDPLPQLLDVDMTSPNTADCISTSAGVAAILSRPYLCAALVIR